MKLNLFLLAVLTALVGINLGIGDNPTRRNLEAMPEMVHTAAYKSFSANPNFADGKTLQLPPEGVIPRGVQPLDYAATPEDAARAGRELHAPPMTPAGIERGAAVYQIYCLPCHGAAGKGDGPVAMRGFPPPPSLVADHARNLAEGQMFHIVTYGQKNMPSYATQVTPDDRWRVIAYLRGLQQPPAGASKEAAKP
ncbi:MAG TPA: cytochrome c [Bryobacteraceae bacterium]|nr:cytochrome c [Bryobacteraceae bacterium]